MAFCITSHRDIFVIYVFSTLKKIKYKWKRGNEPQTASSYIKSATQHFLQQRQQHSPPGPHAFIPKMLLFSIYKKKSKKAAARHSIAYYTKARQRNKE